VRYFVTGSAGFIGSHLVDRLLADGHEVVGYDNFSTGFEEFISAAIENPRFTQINADLLDRHKLTESMQSIDAVFHLAANADVRFGTDHPGRDLEQITMATFHVLEAMRANNVKKIMFSSALNIATEHPKKT